MAIDVFIVGGYLGSGKSSLVNHLLLTSDKKEVGIIVNDLAPVNVDAKHIIQEAGATIGIQDGCACCTVTDRLGEAFDRLIAFRPTLRRIIVEASGVGDPYRISYPVLGSPELTLRAMLTVVDAAKIIEYLDDKFIGSLTRQQIRAADQLIINKIDMASPRRLSEVAEVLSESNKNASIVRAQHGRIDASTIFSLDYKTSLAGLPSAASPFACDLEPAANEFCTIVLRTTQPIDREHARRALLGITSDVERVKGVVVTSDDRCERYLVQVAGGEVQFSAETSSATYRESVLVFVFKGAPLSLPTRQKLIDQFFSPRIWRSNVLIG